MDYYARLIGALNAYFGRYQALRLFQHGGCCWLAERLHRNIWASEIMVNRRIEHCALWFGNGLYDITGKISAKGFVPAEKKELAFMRKNYRLKCDVEKLEKYLTERGL